VREFEFVLTVLAGSENHLSGLSVHGISHELAGPNVAFGKFVQHLASTLSEALVFLLGAQALEYSSKPSPFCGVLVA